MDIKIIESKFWELKGKFMSGVIDESTFKQEMKSLKFKDDNGNWWKPSPDTGKWTTFDGDEWIETELPSFDEKIHDDISQTEPQDEFQKDEQSSEATDSIEIEEDTEVEYVYEEGIDEEECYADMEHLEGSLREIEEMELPKELRDFYESDNPNEGFNIEDVSTYKYSKIPKDEYFRGVENASYNLEISDDDYVSPPLKPDVSLTTKAEISGQKPQIPADAPILRLVSVAASAVAVSKTRSVVKKAVERKEEVSGMKCENCENTLKKDAKFCPKCGTEIEAKKLVVPEKTSINPCNSCGHDNKAGAKFCNKCGGKLGSTSVEIEDKTICKACKFKNKDNAKFCVKCGTRF